MGRFFSNKKFFFRHVLKL